VTASPGRLLHAVSWCRAWASDGLLDLPAMVVAPIRLVRNLGKLTPAQLECLAREEMKLNELERMTANFGTVEAAEMRH
jgi:hypothetical protein